MAYPGGAATPPAGPAQAGPDRRTGKATRDRPGPGAAVPTRRTGAAPCGTGRRRGRTRRCSSAPCDLLIPGSAARVNPGWGLSHGPSQPEPLRAVIARASTDARHAATLPAPDAPPGVTLVADDRAIA